MVMEGVMQSNLSPLGKLSLQLDDISITGRILGGSGGEGFYYGGVAFGVYDCYEFQEFLDDMVTSAKGVTTKK